MKKANKHTPKKPSKGVRLRWSSFKEGVSVKITNSMVTGRSVPENEIKNRQQDAGPDNLSLLVP